MRAKKTQRKQTKSPKKRKGGSAIGQGSYGCVLDRPLRCANGDNAIDNIDPRRVVSKLFMDKYTYKTEVNNMNTIAAIPGSDGWSLLMQGNCQVDMDTPNATPDEEEACNVLNQRETASDPIYQIIMTKGSISLDAFIKSGGKLSIYDFCRYIKNVLQGVCAMHASKLMHLDIKPGNVVLKQMKDDDVVVDEMQAYLIDFSLMSSLKEPLYTQEKKHLFLNSANTEHGHFMYQWYPPEFRIYGLYLQQKPIKETTVLQLLNEQYGKDLFIQDVRQLADEVLEFAGVVDPPNFDRYNTCVDVFSVAMTFTRLLDCIDPRDVYANQKEYATIRRLLRFMRCGNPICRMSHTAAYRAFSDLVTAMKTKSEFMLEMQQKRAQGIRSLLPQSQQIQQIQRASKVTEFLNEFDTRKKQIQQRLPAIFPTTKNATLKENYEMAY